MPYKKTEEIEYFLPDSFKGLSKSYMLQCINDDKIQDNWYPSVGDIIVGPTGNVFVISGKHNLVDEMGGTLFFFGGGLCNRSGGHVADETFCYTMNKSGKWYEHHKGGIRQADNLFHSSFDKFKYVPYPHEIDGELVNGYIKEPNVDAKR